RGRVRPRPLDRRRGPGAPRGRSPPRRGARRRLRRWLVSRPPALVVAGPGTNRDRDLALALERAGADPKIVLVADLVARPAMLDDARLVAVAGGFSYGDALGAGRMLALDLKVGLGDALARFVESGRPLIGICNGC